MFTVYVIYTITYYLGTYRVYYSDFDFFLKYLYTFTLIITIINNII